jgi:two-component system OmpR family sensor kinase
MFLYINDMLIKKDNFEFIRKCVFLAHTGRLNEQNYSEDTAIGIKIIDNPFQKEKILQKGQMVFERKNHRNELKLIKYYSNQYLYLHTKNESFLIQKNEGFSSQEFVLLLWFAFTLSLLILYISILRSFYPLKKLKSQIENFKKGNLDIDLGINRKDEIGYIAKEFEEAIYNIKRVTQLRKWFLRNVAHELKTPIAKGKIATELLEDEKRKKTFSNIFTRLDRLVNELLSIERLASKNMDLNMKCYQIEDIISNAKDILFLETSRMQLNLSNTYKVKVDFDMFSIAVKNLMDNAIKFSFDKKVVIDVKDNKISFMNKGKMPSIEQKLFFEPFSKETSQENKDGLGLGLYITKFIIDKHNLNIYYHYEEDKNIFTIDLKNVIC